MTTRVPNVLTIAGSDPSGGAGIQADLKTFAALRVYGCSVITALTVQNTTGVFGVMPVPADFVRQQLEAVLSDVRIDAVKIGMLGTAEVARTVADVLREHRPQFIVVDPVLRSSTGAALLEPAGVEVLRNDLFPLATVITPNTDEAATLLGVTPPQSIALMRGVAARLVAGGAQAALVTGGHVIEGSDSVDILQVEGIMLELRTPRVSASGTHGTGCTLSSAIASLLALGNPLPLACEEAQHFVAESIARGAELTVGKGNGPVHQLGELWAR